MENLTVLEYNNKRILTTKQLAEVYETKENNIQNNFNNNKDRFIEGEHYYILTGEELQQFKSQVNDIDLVDDEYRLIERIVISGQVLPMLATAILCHQIPFLRASTI